MAFALLQLSPCLSSLSVLRSRVPNIFRCTLSCHHARIVNAFKAISTVETHQFSGDVGFHPTRAAESNWSWAWKWGFGRASGQPCKVLDFCSFRNTHWLDTTSTIWCVKNLLCRCIELLGAGCLGEPGMEETIKLLDKTLDQHYVRWGHSNLWQA